MVDLVTIHYWLYKTEEQQCSVDMFKNSFSRCCWCIRLYSINQQWEKTIYLNSVTWIDIGQTSTIELKDITFLFK
jgi:hypothetical protein